MGKLVRGWWNAAQSYSDPVGRCGQTQDGSAGTPGTRRGHEGWELVRAEAGQGTAGGQEKWTNRVERVGLAGAG
jgi:hypothetical protein